jgi:tetratricopeptide (TPR) repeat protein
MQTHCPSCGAELFPGARFCRRCGAPVREPGEGTGDVSPMAATVPLSEVKGRETDGLPPEEERASHATTRVSLDEMERLLRAQQQESAGRDQSRPAQKWSDSDTTHSRPDPEATLAQFGRDTIADSRAPGDGEARDPEATLLATSAVTRPEVPADFGPGEDLTIPVPRPAPPTATFTAPNDSGSLAADSSSPPQRVTRDAPAYATGDVGADAQAQTSPPPPDGHASTTTAQGAQASTTHGPQASTTTQGAQAAATTQDAQASPTTQAAQSVTATQGAQPVTATRGASARSARRRWPLVVAACGVLLLFAVAAAWVGYRLLRRPRAAEIPSQGASATPLAPDAQQQFDELLAQAEALLAQGNMDEALARLRDANALDPSNVRAHRRLGELLLAAGARRDAVEEFRAVTRNAPDDSAAWRQLATAQFAEGLYRDAAESYRRLVALVGDAADPSDLLSYADSLRLSGRPDEARAVYQRLASASTPDVADEARKRLADLAREQPTPGQHAGEQNAAQPREGEVASSATPAAQPTPAQPAPTPTPQTTPTPQPTRPPASTPAEHYRRGVELWASSRSAALQEFQAAAAGGNPDAHYYLGLGFVEGKNVRTLNQAALVAALQHFQLAERGGEHASDARRYEQELGKEFDRRRNQR